MKKLLTLGLYLCMALGFWHSSKATHILGGEITYRCLGSGLFEFTVVVYRDCGGNTAGFNNATINLQGPHGQTALPLISSTDISPRCNSGTTFSCNPPTTGLGSQGSVSRFVFRDNVNLNAIGVPPVNVGHTFWVTLPCCRSSAITNSLAVNGSQSLQVKMYRYTNPATGSPLTPAQLCDQSPAFERDLSALYIQNPFDTVSLLATASDPDVEDVLVYAPGAPLNDQRTPFAYTHPYSFMNPLPGLLGPPLVSATNSPINTQTGEILFRPTVSGTFALVVTVASYRDDQKISEVFRDANVKIIPNPAGSPPPFEPDTIHVNHFFSQRPPVILPPLRTANGQGIWEVQGYAGLDTMVVTVPVNDLFPGRQGDPLLPQSWQPFFSPFVTSVSSTQLSTTNQTASGCDLPPCATIRNITDPDPPASNTTTPVALVRGNGQSFGQGYAAAGTGGVKIIFMPQTQHLGAQGSQGPVAKAYPFQITALDRNCPIEGEARRVVQLNVKPFEPYIRPVFDSVVLHQGRNRLHFWSGLDTLYIDPVDLANFSGTLSPSNQQALLQKAIGRRERAFGGLLIYKGITRTGPFQLLATITNPRQRTFTDTSILPGSFYYLESLTGRPLTTRQSLDTLGGCTVGNLEVLSSQSNWLCDGGATLQLTSSLVQSGFSYQWYRNGVPLPGQIAPSIIVNSIGNYQLVIFNQNTVCFSNSPVFRVKRGQVFTNEQLCAVTVDSITGRNLILWERTFDKGTKNYLLLREYFNTGQFDTIAHIPFELAGAYLDTAVETNSSAWRYTLLLEDSCGQRSPLSAIHRSMHLTAQAGSNNEVVLNWNGYEGKTIGLQRVMFAHNSTTFTLLTDVSFNIRTMTHYFAPPGPKAYYISIGTGNDCELASGISFPAGTLSNIAQVGSGVGLPWLDRHQATIYPNPSAGLFRVSWDVPASEVQLVQLYNGQGKLVGTYSLHVGESALEIDLQDQAPGIYLLRSQGSVWSQRLVLVR